MHWLKGSLLGALALSVVACSSTPKNASEADMDMANSEQQTEDYAEKARLALEKANADKAEVEVLQAEGVNGQALSSEDMGAEDLPEVTGADAMAHTFEPVIYFGYDQFIVDDTSLETVKHYAAILVDNPDEKIQLIGHTDERGTPEYNLALGERRAKAVAEAFMLYGVNTSRIAVITMGEEVPADLAHTEAAWAKNRRVEIKAQ
ncbi:OmpA family protein [Hydrogenovibrio sp. SC-1]|uniref:OmpA family protein n=1 Tax=Hydrogenovibrio sp. SC-1 TaxID=2065820 RepID=UPI001304152F|nr:OmpA family protein [Hydrogenovibrio sp. SC-1]